MNRWLNQCEYLKKQRTKSLGQMLYSASRRKEGKTLKEIGILIGKSPERVRQILAKYERLNNRGYYNFETTQIECDVYEEFKKHYEEVMS